MEVIGIVHHALDILHISVVGSRPTIHALPCILVGCRHCEVTSILLGESNHLVEDMIIAVKHQLGKHILHGHLVAGVGKEKFIECCSQVGIEIEEILLEGIVSHRSQHGVCINGFLIAH